MDAIADVSRLFQELGATPDDVAATLRTNKIQGLRNAARYLNPVVRYVQVRFQDEAVDMDLFNPVRLSIHFRSGPTQEIPIPEPVRQFLDAFNRGEFPFLELVTERR